MAGFCPRCGKPMPEVGPCPCTLGGHSASNPLPRYSSGTDLSGALSDLPNLFSRYFRNPVEASRRAIEKRDHSSGVAMMILAVLLSVLSTLFFALRYSGGRFGRVAVEWLVTGLAAPILALAITFGLLYVLTSIAAVRIDLRSVIALVGLNLALPLVVLLLSMLLSLVHMAVFEIFTVLLFAAWAVSFFLMTVQILGIRLTLPTCLVTMAGMTVAYYVISFLRSWLVLSLA